MEVKTPADVMQLAEDQKQRSLKILRGELPAPTEAVAALARQYGKIHHDLEVVEIRIQKTQNALTALQTTYAKLQGAAENVERNVALMEWYGDGGKVEAGKRELEAAKPPPKETEE